MKKEEETEVEGGEEEEEEVAVEALAWGVAEWGALDLL